MATGGPSVTKGKEEDARYTCCLCMEPYRGRRPKLLPCYHTFCLPCLTALEASVRSAKRDTATDDDLGQKETQIDQAASPKGEEGEGEAQLCEEPEGTSPLKDAPTGSDDVTVSHDDVDRGSFLCPTCRAPVPIPVGGVAALQTNSYVDQDLDPEEDLSSVLCDMCEEDNRQHATHTCQECPLSMCRTCRRCHDIMARDHHVTPVNPGQPAKQKQEKKELCLIHQDQITCLYCRQCGVSICLHCKLTSHDRHETIDLVGAALQAREEITSLIPSAEQQLQVMEMSIQQVDREDRQLTRHVQDVTQQIHARYDVLMTWARQSRNQLVEEVSAKEASARSQLQAEKASSTLTRDTLSTLLSRAARATAADPDVVMWRKELKAALLPDDKLDQHKQRADSQVRSWNWGYDVTDASVLHEDDIRAYMGRVVEGADAEVNRVPVSLRELADRVERWMKEVTENTHTLTSQLTSCTDDVTTLQKKGDELAKELERKTTSLQEDITRSREAEADLQKSTQSFRENFGKAGELFFASKLNRDKLTQDKAMIFDEVHFNEDDHYQPETGLFTAPWPGLYIFSVGVESHYKNATVHGHVMVDDDLHSIVPGGFGGGSEIVVVPLTAGQTVWVRAVCHMGQYHCWGSGSWFRGTLVLQYP